MNLKLSWKRWTDFHKIHENSPFMTVVLGDYNAKSNNWCKADITSLEGSKMGTIARSYGLIQLIWKPTHILYLSSSCTDLIFTLQPNLVRESEIHSHLHLNYHHQIIFAKFDLYIFYTPLVKELLGIMKEQILTLSEELLISLTG